MPDDTQSKTTFFQRIKQKLLPSPKNRDQLMQVLTQILGGAQEQQVLDHEALGMIEGVMQVSEMKVRDIMIPRSQMVVLEQDMPLDELLPIIVESAHSRFPVIGEDRDEIVGILLAKDLLSYYVSDNQDDFHMRDVLRSPAVIPESKRLNTLLKEFRLNHNHMAIVVDEYGGVAGLVTIEDVLEQIVGEIEDESDIEEDLPIKKQAENLYTVKAFTPLEELNEYFNCKLQEDNIETVGGLLIQKLGYLPKHGEVITIDQFTFKILHADRRRIHLIQLKIQTKET